MSGTPVDPCAEAARLREILAAIATGESVASTRFGEREIRYHKADLGRLERLIDYYERACTVAEGGTSRRTRYAKAMRFRCS